MSKDQLLIKKSVQIFLILFLLSSPVVWLSLKFTNYQGDLTRIGKWSEADFMGKHLQPSIPNNLLISNPINESDVLVIGDSFSERLQWQSVYQQRGLKITTLLWSDVDYLCEDFTKNIEAAGFQGKKIILESIERVAVRQINKSIRCAKGKNLTSNPQIKGYSKAPPTFNNLQAINLSGQFIAGLQTIFHTFTLRWIPNYPSIHNYNSKSTHIYPLENGCQVFSHQRCNYGLFFYEDYLQDDLDESTIEQIKLLNQRINASKKYEITWVIIPNKSSIYQQTTSEKFWRILEKYHLGPDTYNYLKYQSTKVIDLYQPNDTHFSNIGYLLLGNKLINER
jgi:hypothetical protein